MAITKTTVVRDITVSNVVKPPVLHLVLTDTWDDPDDNDLPMIQTRKINVEQGHDISQYPQLVRDIAGVIWS